MIRQMMVVLPADSVTIGTRLVLPLLRQNSAYSILLEK
jgi:hypothetical protein